VVAGESDRRVAPRHKMVHPSTERRRDYGGGRARSLWQRHLHADRSAFAGAEFEADGLRPKTVSSRTLPVRDAIEAGFGRQATQEIVLVGVENLVSSPLPILGGDHGASIKELQRIGEKVVPWQGVEVRWQFTGRLLPRIPRRNLG